jgi:endonuclease/exonuclease/phosphatase family metal-dependent hydrolase
MPGAARCRTSSPTPGPVVPSPWCSFTVSGTGPESTTRRRATNRPAGWPELVERAREDEDITVVCGDLNLLPVSRTFDVLSRIGLTDLVGEADTRTSRYRSPVRHAGDLLISDPSAVRSFSISAAPEASDHRALMLDL